MAQPKFEKKEGLFVCSNGEQELYKASEIGFMFDKNGSVLLYHGPSSFVLDAYRLFTHRTLCNRLLPQHEKDRMIDGIVCIRGQFDLDDLNKVISIADYIGILYKKELVRAEQQAIAAINKIMSIT